MSLDNDFDGFSLTVKRPEPEQPRIPAGSDVQLHSHQSWACLHIRVEHSDRVWLAAYDMDNPGNQVTSPEGLRQLARGLLEVADRIEK